MGQGLPGERIHYVIEEEPLGVAHALNLARPYNKNARLMVYFSDNITTLEFAEHVEAFVAAEAPPGCLLIARQEAHPEAFGVAVFDDEGNILFSSTMTANRKYELGLSEHVKISLNDGMQKYLARHRKKLV